MQSARLLVVSASGVPRAKMTNGIQILRFDAALADAHCWLNRVAAHCKSAAATTQAVQVFASHTRQVAGVSSRPAGYRPPCAAWQQCQRARQACRLPCRAHAPGCRLQVLSTAVSALRAGLHGHQRSRFSLSVRSRNFERQAGQNTVQHQESLVTACGDQRCC